MSLVMILSVSCSQWEETDLAYQEEEVNETSNADLNQSNQEQNSRESIIDKRLVTESQLRDFLKKQQAEEALKEAPVETQVQGPSMEEQVAELVQEKAGDQMAANPEVFLEIISVCTEIFQAAADKDLGAALLSARNLMDVVDLLSISLDDIPLLIDELNKMITAVMSGDLPAGTLALAEFVKIIIE